MRWIGVFGIVAILSALSVTSPMRAQSAPNTLPTGFTRETLGAGLNEPTAMVFENNGRILVTEKDGAIRVVRPNGTLRGKPLHTLSVNTYSERGLLGIALDPNYNTNKTIYVYYTTGPAAKRYNGTPENRVARLKKRKDGKGFKEKIILDHIPSTGGNHNGGDIHFGFDGKMYISVGESGCCPDDAQGLDTLRGKILRINSNGTIPSDNPFYNTPGARQETFAYGLRNPWRFTKRESNQTYIVSDVGAGTWEEINSLEPGGNYGWPQFEGPCPFSNPGCNPNTVNYGGTVKPAHWYHHSNGTETGTVIAGGVFAEDSNYPAPYANAYFYGDTNAGWVHAVTMDGNNQVTGQYDLDDDAGAPVAFGRGPDGNVYVVNFGGSIFKYVYTP
ncbi:MAG: PQQ-dependent sugar dehydrogenase [Anaerolineae bacterium]|nr:PQQ-dependent sugar dehydrogenase [Anaerolineae bacterium]